MKGLRPMLNYPASDLTYVTEDNYEVFVNDYVDVAIHDWSEPLAADIPTVFYVSTQVRAGAAMMVWNELFDAGMEPLGPEPLYDVLSAFLGEHGEWLPFEPEFVVADPQSEWSDYAAGVRPWPVAIDEEMELVQNRDTGTYVVLAQFDARLDDISRFVAEGVFSEYRTNPTYWVATHLPDVAA